jgi:hypothetical protein
MVSATLRPCSCTKSVAAWSGAKNEFQKPVALALGTDFTAAKEIALRDDADQLAGRVDHRKPADMPLQHRVRGFDDRGLRSDGDNGQLMI